MCPKVRHILVTYLLIKFINKILEKKSLLLYNIIIDGSVYIPDSLSVYPKIKKGGLSFDFRMYSDREVKQCILMIFLIPINIML